MLSKLIITALVLAVILILALPFLLLNTWIRARASACHISLFSIIGMKLRQINPDTIVEALIRIKKGDLDSIMTDELEAHYLAKGNILTVIDALIAAEQADLELTFQQAAAIDLAGRDVVAAVQTCIKPRIIDCPDQSNGQKTIKARAKDTVKLRCKARIKLRVNLSRLIGGATEETLIARVSEAIVSRIGSQDSHEAILLTPSIISSDLLSMGLDEKTAFDIISIDLEFIE